MVLKICRQFERRHRRLGFSELITHVSLEADGSVGSTESDAKRSLEKPAANGMRTLYVGNSRVAEAKT